jgi:hypothetical protein
MLDVLTLFVERVEESETTMTWLSWDEKIRMIIEFDSKACFFVEDSIDSVIDRFADISLKISTKNDSSRFFLIQMTDETR